MNLRVDQSIVVDAGKTGYQIDKHRIQEIRKIVGNKYPDFLQKTKSPSYPSETILGILYRRAVSFKNGTLNLSQVHNVNNSVNNFTTVTIIINW